MTASTSWRRDRRYSEASCTPEQIQITRPTLFLSQDERALRLELLTFVIASFGPRLHDVAFIRRHDILCMLAMPSESGCHKEMLLRKAQSATLFLTYCFALHQPLCGVFISRV